MYSPVELDIAAFINTYIENISQKYKQACSSYFIATNSGKEEDYNISAQMQLAVEKIYTNKNDFQQIVKFREMNIEDPLLKRQIELLFLAYQSKQIDEKKLEEMVTLENAIESKFATFRADVEGTVYTDNQIEEVLMNSHDSGEVKKAWIASKTIGKEVAQEVIQIVRMRNEVAKSLGYENYHTMSLELDEQKPEEISKIFEDLDVLTRDSFSKEKENIDNYLAKKFGIDVSALMPWHYQNRYFQEAPKIYDVDIDAYYKHQDIVELSRKYYESIGLETASILENSDLYERDGKYQHAYCMSDRLGMVRILCNVKPNSKRMNTMLHELGHAVYDKYLDPNTPYILYEPAHTFTTEAIAMLFGRFASHPQWIQDMLGISDEEKNNIADACFATLRLEQLVSSRRMQVMYHFEKNMYANPDQDLNSLRRDLVEKYQMMKRPEGRDEPDRASKIHVACYPCYYHNYQLGELLASQMYYYMVNTVLKSSDTNSQSFFAQPEIGKYLKEKIFYAGRTYDWNTMIELATGEKLTPKYYAKQFVH